jgi:hypothetical protein
MTRARRLAIARRALLTCTLTATLTATPTACDERSADAPTTLAVFAAASLGEEAR